MLSRRAYSTFKLQRKLKQKKYPANEIELVLKILASERYLRDDLYAEARIRTWMQKGNSAQQMKRMLEREKLSLPIERIREIFSEADNSEEAQIKRLLDAQMRKMRTAPTDPKATFKLKQKWTAALMRKGHGFSAIKKAIDQISQSAFSTNSTSR